MSKTNAFRSEKDKRNYYILLVTFIVLSILSALALLLYKNPVPVNSPSFIPVVKRRAISIVAMLIAAICQSLSTIMFQSITNNKIITPSLLGFDALYTAINTTIMFLFGASTFINIRSTGFFLFEIGIMIGMCLILYGWLLAGKYGNLQLMLLVGVIMGTGLRSLSSFMRKLLSPSEFDILQARLFGSVNNADSSYFPVAIPVVLVTMVLVFMYCRKLNVISLGKNTSITLGVDYSKNSILGLVYVAILMSVSTALVGSMTFYGFLVSMLTYQIVRTYDHRYIFPMALALAFLIITGSYFIMYHIFNAQGVVSIIMELVGGIVFLIMIFRRGTL